MPINMTETLPYMAAKPSHYEESFWYLNPFEGLRFSHPYVRYLIVRDMQL